MRKRFGEFSIEKGYITEKQLTEALNYQKEHGGLIGELLCKLGFMTFIQKDEILALQMEEYTNNLP